MCSIIRFMSLTASIDDRLETSICMTSSTGCTTLTGTELWIFVLSFTGDASWMDDNSVAIFGVFSEETFWLFSWEFSNETSRLFSWQLSVSIVNVFSRCFSAKSNFTSVMYCAFFACVYRPVLIAATYHLTLSITNQVLESNYSTAKVVKF